MNQAASAPAIADAAQPLRLVEAEIGKVLVGQRELVRRLLIGLLCDAHLLLEGLPGLAKTTVVRALVARARAVMALAAAVTPAPRMTAISTSISTARTVPGAAAGHRRGRDQGRVRRALRRGRQRGPRQT